MDSVFFFFATLSKISFTERSMIPTNFTPVVDAILGTSFNSEPLLAHSAVGMLVIIFGAWLTSKPELQASISPTATR